MISKNLNDELNKQITYEFYSSHLYLAMAAKFASIDFTGASTWMKTQAEEERIHAIKIMDFIIEAGGEAKITGFEDPEVKGEDLKSIFEQALEHERFVTERINFLMSLAGDEKNYHLNAPSLLHQNIPVALCLPFHIQCTHALLNQYHQHSDLPVHLLVFL